MAYLFILKFSDNSIARSREKRSAKSANCRVILIKAHFCFYVASKKAQEGYITGSKGARAASCMTNVSKYLS